MSLIRTGPTTSKSAEMPARIPPVIAKVWVYDQLINGNQWLQGTWLFIEVDRGRWLPEVDSGHGNFAETGRVEIKTKEPGHEAK